MVRFSVVTFGSVVIATANLFLYANPPRGGKPWHPNTREHLFGFVDDNDNIIQACSIEDEGFRWRNSLNFTVNGNNIAPANWWFNKVVRFNPAPVNNFLYTDDSGTRIDYTNNASADDIHTYLAEIARNVATQNKATVAVSVAITIVIENGGVLHAFSKVLTNENGEDGNLVIASFNRGEQNVQNLLYALHNPTTIRNNLKPLDPLNLPFPSRLGGKNVGYGCSEGKILSMLVADNFLLFKSQIKNLLTQASTQLDDRTLNCGSIHTIILHINTTMDPCAICTRCLVGLSKYLNDGQNIQSLQPTNIGGALSANLFIEVSSNGRYLGSNRNAIGSFTGYFAGIRSSHAECGGHDGQEETHINLRPKGSVLFPGPDNFLYILPGGIKPWRFNHTFPPYIAFCRLNAGVPNRCIAHGGDTNLPPVQ